LLRSFLATVFVLATLLGPNYFGRGPVSAQEPQPAATPQRTPTPERTPAPANQKPAKIDKNNLTAEQVAEVTILSYGSRPVLAQIRRNGVERGRLTRFMPDGKIEESSYERRFIRGENAEKDKVRLDQKTPSLEYSLIYGDGRLWGIINGTSFVPRADAASTFRSQHLHSIDALLRYAENGSTLKMIGKQQQKGLDLYVLDLTDKEKQTTRYYISAKSYQVLWLEFEDTPEGGSTPLKYVRKFLDYRIVQSTRVPYKTVLLEEGRQTQETRILTITYGVKIDDGIFKNPAA
jgi:hypothetical protein